MGRSDLAIVIPCYNEQNTIGNVVRGCVDTGDVFVVDDASTDASKDIATREGATVLDTGGRFGYERVIEFGLREAYRRGYRWVVTIDADGEHDPHLVQKFLSTLRENPNLGLVAGIRERPQRLAEWIVCGYCRWRFGLKDVLCGMKGYSRELLDLYFASGHSNLVNTWPALLWAARRYPFSQMEVTGKRRQDHPRFSSRIRANKIILKMLGPISKLDAPGGAPA
ncbi:glycosyltransferase family 2 protein [Pseudomonas sp. R2.Fl]|nr:glycosyltransferase family 2 protein [Pseudomonas sp. R2.Fl]